MEIPLFLAMTAAEFQGTEVLPEHPAWMACHFSSYGIGISNLPQSLPDGAMLILNDRTPICGHDPETVAMALCDAAHKLECAGILLDFQREGYDELLNVIKAVLKHASCPVGVSSLYAAEFDCPVLVPPIPPHILPEDAVAPWKGRELWLEVSSEGTVICVTPDGSHYTSLPYYCPKHTDHYDKELHCHYSIIVEENQIVFQLGRSEDDQRSLVKAAEEFGVTQVLRLWQETER